MIKFVKMIKKSSVLVIMVFFSSCFILFPDSYAYRSADYTLNKLWFNTALDYNKNVSYLLNTTQLAHKASTNDGYNKQLLDYFKDNIGSTVYPKANFKDADGKLILPFKIDYSLPDANLELLKNTNLDYVIVSKILTPQQINNTQFAAYKNLTYASNTVAGMVVFLKVYDIKNNKVAIELQCKSAVYDGDENFNFETNRYELDDRITVHKSEDKLLKKCFKKIFKTID